MEALSLRLSLCQDTVYRSVVMITSLLSYVHDSLFTTSTQGTCLQNFLEIHRKYWLLTGFSVRFLQIKIFNNTMMCYPYRKGWITIWMMFYLFIIHFRRTSHLKWRNNFMSSTWWTSAGTRRDLAHGWLYSLYMSRWRSSVWSRDMSSYTLRATSTIRQKMLYHMHRWRTQN